MKYHCKNPTKKGVSLCGVNLHQNHLFGYEPEQFLAHYNQQMRCKKCSSRLNKLEVKP